MPANTRYEKIDFLGEGQFATVYKAKDKEDNDNIVAVKKIKIGSRQEAKDGINRTALREIKLLREISSHENIISLRDVFGQKSNISLVFDFMDIDLEIIIKDTSLILKPSDVKSYFLQTLCGLEFLHSNWILHRDMKPNNLLMNKKGILKIADFGLAKFYGSPVRPMTHQVVTRWYRPPELLYGSTRYACGVDIWATGCIVAELLQRLPFLPGESDLDQLTRIFQALGSPTEETWPNVHKLPAYVQFKHCPGTPLAEIFSAAAPDLVETLVGMFTFDPRRRFTAKQLLNLPYFSNKPTPTVGYLLPLPSKLSEVIREPELVTQKRRFPEEYGATKPKKLLF